MLTVTLIAPSVLSANFEESSQIAQVSPVPISCTIERRSMDNKQEDEYIVDHMALDEFNSHVWDLKKFNGKSNVRITNLQIHPNEKITNENMIYVLYSVIFVGKRR